MPGVELPEGTVYGAKSFIGKNHKAGEFELWINNKKHTDRNKSMISGLIFNKDKFKHLKLR